MRIFFWQLIVSPHMANLAVALAKVGIDVTYVVRMAMSKSRAELGWSPPDLPGVCLRYVESEDEAVGLANNVSPDVVHICQGLRGNGYVDHVQSALQKKCIKYWVIMETVDDRGLTGALKRIVYSRVIAKKRNSIAGILANGHKTKDWLVSRGFSKEKIFNFAYFLKSPVIGFLKDDNHQESFKVLYVGRLTKVKRVDLLINALSNLSNHKFEFWVVGLGELNDPLKRLAGLKLRNRVIWLGALPNDKVFEVMRSADCVVLPSDHDGWGAVAAEAIMVGTPVVCSDACGVADVIRRSGGGMAFSTGSVTALEHCLGEIFAQGRISSAERIRLADWSQCLSAEIGAGYLIDILSHEQTGQTPVPPWER